MDSVSIDQADKPATPSGGAAADCGCQQLFTINSLKKMIALFLIFMFVCADYFVGGMSSLLGSSAVRSDGRLRPSGYVVQGIILVILFALVSYLNERGWL